MTLLTRRRQAAYTTQAERRTPITPAADRPLPPSVARFAERTRLSAELLAAMLEVDERTRVSLDDIERADALADRLLARRRERRAAVAA